MQAILDEQDTCIENGNTAGTKTHREMLEESNEVNYCSTFTRICQRESFILNDKKHCRYISLLDTSDKRGAKEGSLRDALGFYIILLNALQLVAVISSGANNLKTWQSFFIFLTIFTRGWGILGLEDITIKVLTLLLPILFWIIYAFLQDRPNFSLKYLTRGKATKCCLLILFLFVLLPNVALYSSIRISEGSGEDLSDGVLSLLTAFSSVVGAITMCLLSFLLIFILGALFLNNIWNFTLWKYLVCMLELLVISATLPVGALVAEMMLSSNKSLEIYIFLGFGIAVMILQFGMILTLASTSSINSAFENKFWRRHIYFFFCRCCSFQGAFFTSSEKIKWPYKKTCWAFPVLILLETWALGFFLTAVDFSEEELDIIGNSMNDGDQLDFVKEVVVAQSLGSVGILSFVTLCISFSWCPWYRKEDRYRCSPYKENLHFGLQ